MLIAFHSMTGNTRRFAHKLPFKRVIDIDDFAAVNEPFVLLTNTIGFGEVPEEVQDFLKDNYQYLRGVASSGNRNWGKNYARAADLISHKYQVPILLKFELSGNQSDVNVFVERVKELERKIN